MYIELQTIKKYEQEKFFRKTFGEIKNSINFAPLSKRKLWKDGRVVDYTGLENRRAERHRGFESLSLRKEGNPKRLPSCFIEVSLPLLVLSDAGLGSACRRC